MKTGEVANKRTTKEEQCNLCFGRGYRVKKRKTVASRMDGIRTINCSRCGGCGIVGPNRFNPNPHVKEE